MNSLENTKISWSGVFAGLLVGTVLFFAVLQLGAFVTALLPLNVMGTGIAAIIWLAVGLFVSSYVAGMVCMFSRPADEKLVTIESTPEEVEATTHRFRKYTKIHGLLVGTLIIILTTLVSVTGLSALISGTLKTAAVTTGASAVATVGGIAGIASLEDVQAYVANISRSDLEKLIADQIPSLDQDQVEATVNTIYAEFEIAGRHLENAPVYNLPTQAEKAYNYLKHVFVDDQRVLSRKLQAEGLSEQEANQVIAVANQYASDLEKKMIELKDKAVALAKDATIYSTLSWMITAALILLAAVCGAMSMAHTETTHEAKRTTKKVRA